MNDRSPGEVCAVIVTYQPDAAVLARVLHETSLQVGRTVIVDNGSDAGALEALAGGCNACSIDIVRLGDNYGVGAAHNAGIRAARSDGCEYVLILDQDSIPQPGMVGHLLQAARTLQSRGVPVSAAGPRYRDPHTLHESYFVRLGTWGFERTYCDKLSQDAIVPVDFLISSGSLIPMAVLDVVGGMDESLFIDHVDTEWCFRARARGYEAFGICQALMHHSLGTRAIRVRALRERQVAIRSPLRLYYMVRNSLLLYRRPHVPLRMRVADLKRLLPLCVFFGMLVPPRVENLRMMLKGAWHGLRGVAGRYGTPQRS